MTGIPKSFFTQAFVVLNQLGCQSFARWVFKPGMEFEAPGKWWEDTGSRVTPHEGLDFCSFEDRNSMGANLVEKSLVPAMYAGTVVKIFHDLLGFSILMVHDFQDKGKTLCSIYAHTIPVDTLQKGSRVRAGEAIAMICSTGKKSIPPHLHLSVVWAEESAIAGLDWETMHQANDVILCNPLDFIALGLTIE